MKLFRIIETMACSYGKDKLKSFYDKCALNFIFNKYLFNSIHKYTWGKNAQNIVHTASKYKDII